LCYSYDDINNDQILDYGRDDLETAAAGLIHNWSKVAGGSCNEVLYR
jgi:hypothetical protein